MIAITSKNRTPAKRLLNTWFDSRAVRVMTLEQLNLTLQRAINEGLITEQGAARALNITYEKQQDSQQQGGHNEDNSSDASEDERDEGFKAQSGDSESDSQEGDESDSEQSKGESDSKGESESDSESDEDGNSKSKGEGESEGEGEDNSEQEQQQQQEQEKQEQQEQEDENKAKDGKLRHEMFSTVRKYIEAGLNVALVGPAGTGKSTIAMHVAEDLGKEFRGTGAVMSKYDLIGYKDATGVYHETPLYDAYTNGHLFNFDEFDASAPDAGVAFNAVTDNQPVFAFPNGMQPKHQDFVAIACMNTYGNGASADYVGRFKQDAAAMSRFVAVYIDYDKRIETAIAGKNKDILQRVWDLRTACENLAIRHIVSTRKILFAVAARNVKATKTEIDRDILFSGLDEATIKQVKSQMNTLARERKANQGSV